MEAHEALRRHEHVAGAHDHHDLELEPDGSRRLAQQAVVVVVVSTGSTVVVVVVSCEPATPVHVHSETAVSTLATIPIRRRNKVSNPRLLRACCMPPRNEAREMRAFSSRGVIGMFVIWVGEIISLPHSALAT